MKNILAALALVAFSMNATAGVKDGAYKGTQEAKETGREIEESYKNVSNPARPFVGVLVSPIGNTIQYVAEGVDIVGKVGVERVVQEVSASGQCLGGATHPGETVACVVVLGGGTTIAIWNTAGYSIANVVGFAGELFADVAQIGAQGGEDLRAYSAEKSATRPILSQLGQGTGYVIRVVLNAAGVVVGTTFMAVADGLRAVTDGGALVIGAVVDVPVSLLRLQPARALASTGAALGAAACTGIDIGIGVWNLGVSLLNAATKGAHEKVQTCMSTQRANFESIRNNTFRNQNRAPAEPVWLN